MRVSAGFAVTGLSGNTRIHTLPPRFDKMGRGAGPASNLAAVNPVSLLAPSTPYSPKGYRRAAGGSAPHTTTMGLAKFDPFGINILIALSARFRPWPQGLAASTGLASSATTATVAAAAATGTRFGGGKDLALIDPGLTPMQPKVVCASASTIVNVRPDGLVGHATGTCPILSLHLGAAQPSGHHNLDPLAPRRMVRIIVCFSARL